MSNREIADIFLEIADLLDLDGEKFKPEAYRRAARSLEDLSTDVAKLVKEGRLGEVPGVGEALGKKIAEYVETGKVAYLDKMRAGRPPGLLELLRVDGMGPKTTRRLHLELGIDGPESLKKAIEEHRLEGLKGFGPKKIELLRTALGKARSRGRTPLTEAFHLSQEVLEGLRASGAPIGRLSTAGSLRRRKETVGDLDFVATSASPRAVMEAFTRLPQVAEVKLSGETKTTVVLKAGIQVDLRVVPEEAYGATLQYLTGSKDHNVKLRTLALDRGLSLNEYGITKDGTLVPAPTETEVYRRLGLAYIPPEMREDQGEIEAARAGQLPVPLGPGEVSGEFHLDGAKILEEGTLAQWTRSFEEHGLEEGGLVFDSRTFEESVWRKTREMLARKRGPVHWTLGLELSPLIEERLAVPADADYVLLRPEEGETELRPKALPTWEFPQVILTHLQSLEDLEGSARPSAQGPSFALEVAVTPEGISPSPGLIRRWSQAGGKVLLSTRPKSPTDLDRLELVVGAAARGWAPREAVLNAKSPD